MSQVFSDVNKQPLLEGRYVARKSPVSIKSGVILETEGSVQKIQKKALFHYKKVKKSIPNLTSPYVHSLFTIVLIKQIFEKSRSSRAAPGSWTQF